MTGTYSGGSLNFAAVGRAVGLPADLFAAATAADNVVTAVWIAASLVPPLWLGRFYAPPPAAEPVGGRAEDAADDGPTAGSGQNSTFATGVVRKPATNQNVPKTIPESSRHAATRPTSLSLPLEIQPC